MSPNFIAFLNRILVSLERALNYLSATLIITMMMISTLNILMRNVFKSPVPGSYETTELMMLGLIFLGLSYVEAAKKNIRVTFLYDAVPARVRKIFDLLILIISLFFWGLFFLQSTVRALHSWEIREFSLGIIEFPLYPAWFVLAIGTGVLTLRFIINLFLFFGKETDVYVPRV